MLTDREQLCGKVFPLVDSSVHGDESLQVQLVLHVGVVEGGVEHDDGEGQDVARVCSGERCQIWARGTSGLAEELLLPVDWKTPGLHLQ